MPLKYTGGYRTDIEAPQENGQGQSTYKKAGIFSRLADDFSRRGKNIAKMYKTASSDKDVSQMRAVGIPKALATGAGILGQAAGLASDVIGEGIISTGRAVLPESAEKEINDLFVKIGESDIARGAMEKWSSFEEKSPYLAETISGAANIASLYGGGKVVPTKIPGSIKSGVAKGAEVAESAIGKARPSLMSAKSAISEATSDVAKNIPTSVVSQVSALSPDTIKSIFRGEISKETMKQFDRFSLMERAKSGLKKLDDDVSDLGSAYNDIRNSGEKVVIPEAMSIATDSGQVKVSKPLVDALKEYGLSIDDNMRITKSIDSKPFDEGTRNAIQEFVNVYGKTGELTADQFLNVRSAASDISRYADANPDLATSFARTLRSNYDAIGKKEIEGLAKLDAKFAPIKSDSSDLLNRFVNMRTGELKDTASSTLANLTNKGREQTLERLEKYVPGITKEIKMLRYVEDLEKAGGNVVGSYGRAAAPAAAGVVAGLPGIAATMLVTQPSLLVPIVRNFGKAYRWASKESKSILQKMDAGLKLSNKELDILRKAVLDASGGLPDVKKQLLNPVNVINASRQQEQN